MVTHQLRVERRTAKERWLETDVLPLSHAATTTATNGMEKLDSKLMLILTHVPRRYYYLLNILCLVHTTNTEKNKTVLSCLVRVGGVNRIGNKSGLLINNFVDVATTNPFFKHFLTTNTPEAMLN